MYPRNAASPPRIAVGPVVQISDGAVQTADVSIKVRPEGGSASAGGGTTAYEEGIVLYTPTQAETNYTAFVVIAYKTSCWPAVINVVTTASATAGKVDVGAFGGTAVTGRDLGASVLLSSGTGTGQISLSSGAVLLQATQSGVTIPTVTTVTNQLTAAQIATGVWQDATAGDFTTASSIGKALYVSNVAPGASGGHMISGTNAGTTTLGALTVTGATTLTGAVTGTNASNDLKGIFVAADGITATSIASNAIAAAKIATGAITNAKFAAGAIDAAAIADSAIDLATFAADVKTGSALKANVETVSANAITAAAIADGAIDAATLAADAWARLGVVAYGTAQAATGTTLQLAASSAFADDELVGAILTITGGTTGVGQSRFITDYVSSTDTATVDTWTTTPTGTITYAIFGVSPASATVVPPVNVTQWTGTAVAAPDTAGYPKVTIKDGTGAGEIALTSGAVDSVTAVGTVTNLTNAPTAGDLTAAMKASVTTAATAATPTAAAVTGNVGGNVTGSVGSVAAGGITASSIATGAIDADALAADAVDEILDEVIEGSVTMRQAMRLFMAALGGKVSGAGTATITFRDTADTTDRIVAAVDGSGNRTTVTLTLT